MRDVVERCLGAPLDFEELKHKPGRRLTLRATGPRRTAIVKLYRSKRVAQVAQRVSALADGSPDVEVPRVLAVDEEQHVLVLSDVPGRPLREAVLAGGEDTCALAGRSIASWHGSWAGTRPAGLSEHAVERELATLADRAALAPREIGARVASAARGLHEPWAPATVVHRDLYEEQILVGGRIGLIDLDDAALGPAELDVGNLLAHLDLLELRTGASLDVARRAFLEGYESVAAVDGDLLERCRTLASLRLACIHSEPRLLDVPIPKERSAGSHEALSSRT